MTTLTQYETAFTKPVTMREVATLAGVSFKTVSRVVNQEAGVSPEVVERVQHAIQRLGYQRNTTASNLRRADQRTATIGLLVDDVSNPFCSELHRAIEEVARQRDTLVFAGSTDDDPKREEEMAVSLASRRIDGLIAFTSNQGTGALAHVRRLGCPIVFVDRPATAAEDDADSVTVDNREGAARAVRHLCQHGHTHIAFLGDLQTIWTARERYRGYVEALATEGVRLESRYVCLNIRSVEQAKATTLKLLSMNEPPTAIFTAQNMLTVGGIQAIQQKGVQHFVGLVGFDDIPMADLLEPKISVVAQNATMIGQRAVEMLFARLDGDTRPSQHIVVPTHFIARGSGEIMCKP